MHPATIIGIFRSLIVDVAMGQIPRSTERISSFRYRFQRGFQCRYSHVVPNLDFSFFILVFVIVSICLLLTISSASVATCEIIPRTRTILGDRSFTISGPRLLNNLPLHLRDSEHTFL